MVMKYVLFAVICLVLGTAMLVINANVMAKRAGKMSKTDDAGDWDFGKEEDSPLASSKLNVDENATFDLAASLTDDELEILADDMRFYADEAFGWNAMLKDAMMKIADNVDDGGIVNGIELKALVDATTEMLEYPLYANTYGRGTPERETILEKLKKFAE